MINRRSSTAAGTIVAGFLAAQNSGWLQGVLIVVAVVLGAIWSVGWFRIALTHHREGRPADETPGPWQYLFWNQDDQVDRRQADRGTGTRDQPRYRSFLMGGLLVAALVGSVVIKMWPLLREVAANPRDADGWLVLGAIGVAAGVPIGMLLLVDRLRSRHARPDALGGPGPR